MTRGSRRESLAELRAAAELEAANLELTPGWEEGRSEEIALAVDPSTTLDRDDAVAVYISEQPNGNHTLRVSFVDTGSFLTPQKTPAIDALAQRELVTTYRSGKVVRSMLPTVISHGKLSISEQPSPVITEEITVGPDGAIVGVDMRLGVMRATVLSYEQMAAMQRADAPAEDKQVVGILEKLALLLRRNRLSKKQLSEDEAVLTGRMSPKEIIAEFMVTANRGAGIYMDQRGMRRINRNHNGAAAKYSVRARGHKGLKVARSYSKVTSPMRDYTNYVNNAILAAHLHGEPSPYSVAQLDDIATRFNNQQERLRLQRHHVRQMMGAGAVARTVSLPKAA